MPKLTGSNVYWPADTLSHAYAMVESLATLRAQTLRDQGYQYLAQIGQDHSLRLRHYPASIDTHGLRLSRLAAGFRAILYSDGQYIYKAGHNLSFEIQREWRQYCETLNRLILAQSEFLSNFEQNLGLLHFSATDSPLRQYTTDPALAPFFRDECVLIKKYATGTTIRDIVLESDCDALTEPTLRVLAEIFRSAANAGIYLQGDPDDFLFDRTTANWTVIDPDGWVVYDPNDPYVENAARAAFLGTFTRLLTEISNESSRANLPALIQRAEEVLKAYWPSVNSTSTTEQFRELLQTDDLVAPRDLRTAALIRCEFHDPLRLDSELGRCSMNVLLTTNDLLNRLLGYRGLDLHSGLEKIYFGDLHILRGKYFAAVFNSYNDSTNARSGDWAYNHTGIKNEEIGALVLAAAEHLSARYPSRNDGPTTKTQGY